MVTQDFTAAGPGCVALVDTQPGHEWTNETRWSLGLGTRVTVPLEPIGTSRASSISRVSSAIA
ncbi:MAG: hypothetical protein KF894_09025 [Labilithrix sp.]|nr:hypothetical protein [Labilithrix sp.]